jgi:hypothetical protein
MPPVSSKLPSLLARILILSFLFVTVLGGTALVIAWVLAWALGAPVITVANLYIGLVCGLIVWLFVAVFHLRKETFHVPVPDRELFLDKIRALLLELGYEPRTPHGEQNCFRPGFQSYWLGGDVVLKVEGRQASITGPKVFMEVLRNRLRIQNHLEKVSLDGRRRLGERLLSRAQITLRVRPDQWQDVHKRVIDVLAKEAEVICELNLLAQADKGLREQLVEFQVREWLEQQGLSVEIHKDYLLKEDADRCDTLSSHEARTQLGPIPVPACHSR